MSGVSGRVGAAVLLVPGGFAVGHEVAYRLGHTGGHEGAPGHGYLSVLATLSVPLALLALGLAVLHGTRRPGATGLRWGSLAALLAGTYIAVEVLEHLAAGVGLGEALVEPSLVLGAVAQLLVAVAAAALLRQGHRLGEALAARQRAVRRWPAAARLGLRPLPVPVAATPALTTISRRGPPQTLLPRH